jgi:pyruvate/2-oxoglutarate dehydrogenase complex dihydrolipoamide acyltransferase (E2) component
MSDATEVLVERSNTNDAAVIVVRWLAAPASLIDRDSPLVEVETSKATVQIVAPAAGYVFYSLTVGDEVPIGEPIAWISPTPSFEIPTAKPAAASPPTEGRGPEFTRKAKKLIVERGMKESDFADLAVVREEDVLARSSARSAATPATAAATEIPSSTRPLSASKAHEAKLLRSAQRTAVYSKVVREVPLAMVRRLIDEYEQRESLKLSIGEAVSHAASRTLPQFPLLNACGVDDGVRLYHVVNLGVAMNVADQGLRVPVVRDADRASLRELSLAIKGLSLKYMRGKLTPADLSAGTFTVTDLSSLGVQQFDPVINAGQSAILGIGAPFLSGLGFNLILAFDHCVLDGMIAAQYLDALVTYLSEKKSA